MQDLHTIQLSVIHFPSAGYVNYSLWKLHRFSCPSNQNLNVKPHIEGQEGIAFPRESCYFPRFDICYITIMVWRSLIWPSIVQAIIILSFTHLPMILSSSLNSDGYWQLNWKFYLLLAQTIFIMAKTFEELSWAVGTGLSAVGTGMSSVWTGCRCTFI